jgi:membrane fusion protein (multidrug efflux system)
MTLRTRAILAATGLLAVALIAWRIIGVSSSADVRRQMTPIVRIESPRRESVPFTLKFTGDVVPIQQANIYAKVGGNLERIFADMGTAVRVNQLLALIDTTELAQQFAQVSATFENARLNYDRTRELSDQNLVARQTLDNAQAAMKVAKANFDAARTRLDYAKITAPFSGMVTRRFLDAGANVTANTTTLFTLMDIGAMKIVVNVLERDIPSVKPGKRAVISVDAYPGKEFFGAIARLSQAVDLATRTMAVEIEIPNTERLLKPGMFASVTLLVEEHPSAITVPTQALQKDDNGDFLYILEGQTAHRRTVRLGSEQHGRTEVLTGLTGAEQIIAVGQQYVKDGAQVTIGR